MLRPARAAHVLRCAHVPRDYLTSIIISNTFRRDAHSDSDSESPVCTFPITLYPYCTIADRCSVYFMCPTALHTVLRCSRVQILRCSGSSRTPNRECATPPSAPAQPRTSHFFHFTPHIVWHRVASHRIALHLRTFIVTITQLDSALRLQPKLRLLSLFLLITSCLYSLNFSRINSSLWPTHSLVRTYLICSLLSGGADHCSFTGGNIFQDNFFFTKFMYIVSKAIFCEWKLSINQL